MPVTVTSASPVEYEELDRGLPMLVLHGAPGGSLDTTRVVGLDFDDPALDLFVAARVRPGPTVLFVERQP
jgi:hypothetical protein